MPRKEVWGRQSQRNDKATSAVSLFSCFKPTSLCITRVRLCFTDSFTQWSLSANCGSRVQFVLTLPIFWSLLLCPSVSLLSKCYNPPRWHCSSPHLHPRTLPSDLTHATASSTLPNSDLQPQLFKGPRLAFPPLCMASSKRKGKSQVRHCRKVDKGRTEIRSLTTRSRSQMMYRRAFLWRGHIRRLCIV